MNEAQEEILAFAYRIAHETPHPYYCATTCRFGTCSSRCFDCSGFTYVCYKRVGVTIGADTGAIARQASPGGWFKPRTAALPADLMLHTTQILGSGKRIYDGGPNEHVGIFVRYDGSRVLTWESAGSQNGVGYYSRHISFWQDAVRVPALASTPRPTPAPPPLEEDMQRLMKDSRPQSPGAPIRFAVGNLASARQLPNPDAITRLKSYRPSPLTDFQELAVDPVDMSAALAR